MRRTLLFISIIGVCGLLLFLPEIANAQCVMCKAVAEDSASDNGHGSGLNRGILYIMVVPYILLAALGFVFFSKRNQSLNS